MDHFQAVRAFVRVAESGSFTRAAESLQMPTATLSKAVQALEKKLGIRLLERTTRRVRVTADGLAYQQRARQLLDELDELEASLGRNRASPRGRVRMDAGGALASALLMPALPDFYRRYPDIQLELGVTDRTVDLIGENIDCAIRSSAQDPSLVARPLGALPWTLCAAPDYLQRHGTPKHPQQIIEQGHRVVSYFSARSGRNLPLRFSHAGEQIDIETQDALRVNESNTHLAAALAGLGLVQTLAFMARPAIARGELVALLPEWQPAPMPMYAVYPPGRQLSARVKAFLDWTAEQFAGVQATGTPAAPATPPARPPRRPRRGIGGD